MEGLDKLKKLIPIIGTRTRDLPACSIVPQPLHYDVLYITLNIGNESILLNKMFKKTKACRTCFQASLSLGVFICPEDGGNMLLRNLGLLSTHYTAIQPGR
jgi:hypothetical protein